MKKQMNSLKGHHNGSVKEPGDMEYVVPSENVSIAARGPGSGGSGSGGSGSGGGSGEGGGGGGGGGEGGGGGMGVESHLVQEPKKGISLVISISSSETSIRQTVVVVVSLFWMKMVSSFSLEVMEV